MAVDGIEIRAKQVWRTRGEGRVTIDEVCPPDGNQRVRFIDAVGWHRYCATNGYYLGAEGAVVCSQLSLWDLVELVQDVPAPASGPSTYQQCSEQWREEACALRQRVASLEAAAQDRCGMLYEKQVKLDAAHQEARTLRQQVANLEAAAQDHNRALMRCDHRLQDCQGERDAFKAEVVRLQDVVVTKTHGAKEDTDRLFRLEAYTTLDDLGAPKLMDRIKGRMAWLRRELELMSMARSEAYERAQESARMLRTAEAALAAYGYERCDGPMGWKPKLGPSRAAEFRELDEVYAALKGGPTDRASSRKAPSQVCELRALLLQANADIAWAKAEAGRAKLTQVHDVPVAERRFEWHADCSGFGSPLFTACGTNHPVSEPDDGGKVVPGHTYRPGAALEALAVGQYTYRRSHGGTIYCVRRTA